MIADQLEGVIICVTQLKSTRKALKRAHQQLSPAPVLGVVLIEGS